MLCRRCGGATHVTRTIKRIERDERTGRPVNAVFRTRLCGRKSGGGCGYSFTTREIEVVEVWVEPRQ